MYDPKFTQKQMYEQYGKSLTNKKKARSSAFVGGFGSGKSYTLLSKVFYCLIGRGRIGGARAEL